MSPIGWSGWNRAGPRRSGRPRCSRRTRCAPRAWERRWRWCGGPAASPGPTRPPSATRCACCGPGVRAPEVQQRVGRALAALGLEAHAAHHPYDLPPAFRKLAALAGALALEPRLLVLDEPTAGLDRALRARVASALLERAAAGAALLVVTHDLAFAAETLERALVLDRGRLACDEPLAGLLAAPPRLEPLGLAPPAVAARSWALGLPGAPVREADAARALARVAAGRRD